MKNYISTKLRAFKTAILLLLVSIPTFGQSIDDINNGLNQGATDVAGLYDTLSRFLWVLAGLGLLVGGYIVFQKYQKAEPDAQKSAYIVAGGVVFLVVINVVGRRIFIG